MTEKRFTIKEFSILDAMASIDVICDEGIELPTSTACDLLNALNDENEQLEKSIEQLRTIIDDNIAFNNLFTNRELSDICNETGWELSEKSIKLQQLEKENEQLKKELFEARKDYLIETADISDKLHLEEWIEKERKEIFK